MCRTLLPFREYSDLFYGLLFHYKWNLKASDSHKKNLVCQSNVGFYFPLDYNSAPHIIPTNQNQEFIIFNRKSFRFIWITHTDFWKNLRCDKKNSVKRFTFRWKIRI